MPAQGGAATPSRGGRGGIDGSDVSRRPERFQIVEMPHLCAIPLVEKEIMHSVNHQPLRRGACGTIFIAFSSGRTTLWLRRLPPAEDLGIVWSEHLT